MANWKDKYDEDIIRQVENRDYASGGAKAALYSDEDYAESLKDSALWGLADEAGKAALHDKNEKIAAKYGFSGGDDGSEYKPYEGAPTGRPSYLPQTTERPAYTSTRSSAIDAALDALLSGKEFSYDYENDPVYQAYKKEYTREGQRAFDDALAQLSARSGGLASSYAGSAAGQAQGYYMQQLTDKIPELEARAYGRYNDDRTRELENLRLLEEMEDRDYSRNRDSVGDWENDRSFAESRADTEYNRRINEAMLAMQNGDSSKLEALGITPDEEAVLRMALASGGRITPIGGSGGSGGGSGSGTGSGGGGTDYVSAFRSGDHSDAVIEGLLASGLTRDQIEAAGYTGDFFATGSSEGSKKANRGDYVYNTIMNEITYGGNIENAMAFATEEIEKGLEDGSIEPEDADRILKLFGY